MNFKLKKLESINSFFQNNKFSGLIIGFIAFLVIFPLSFSDLYETFELKLYDLRFALKPSISEWDKLYFIDIDENSISSLGQFPWTRDIYAKGLSTLKDVEISQIAFDIMFPENSPSQIDDNAFQLLKNKITNRKIPSTDEVESVVKNNDNIFAQAIKNHGNVILSYTFTGEALTIDTIERQKSKKFIEAIKRFTSLSSIPVPQGKEKLFAPLQSNDATAIVYPIPELMNSAKSFGFVNRFTDIDGTVRRVKLLQVYNGRIYFNLALMMLFDECNIALKDIEVNPGKNIILKNALNPMTHSKKDIVIPIDKGGMIYVNWAGPGPREKSFHLFPFMGLLEYPKFASSVHDFFDSALGTQGITERMQIEQDIASLKEKYISAKNDEERKNISKELISKNSQLRNEYLKALELLKEEKKKLEEKAKSDPNNLQKEIESIDNDIKAVELVLNTESLKDKMGIVGLTATGTHDIASIPLHNEYPGVGTYHNTINTIINNEYIKRVSTAFSIFMIFIIALISGFIIQKLDSRKSLTVAISGFILLNIICFYLFSFHNVWIEQLGLNLAFIVPATFIISIKLINEESQKRFIKGAFSRYLAPDVIEQIVAHPETLELGGEERIITIFFSDVAGFSTISEKLTPPELVSLLNEYLSEMTDIIISHGGTVDKYEGDAIMAFYGAPHPYVDHELRACLAAIDMKKRLRELQEHWKAMGQYALSARMGMNTGRAIVGNMGSRLRMDYTAMGDSVNLASRLEGANKFYGTSAMISENTYRGAKDHIEARKLDIIKVVGKSEPVEIYELLGKKGTLPQYVYDCLEHYNKGLEFFQQRQWKKAHSAFSEALKILPDDGPSKTYIARCEEFIKKPPSKKWDGVYTLTSK
jgi:adenylate cyclase